MPPFKRTPVPAPQRSEPDDDSEWQQALIRNLLQLAQGEQISE
jgi:hypothetical protein